MIRAGNIVACLQGNNFVEHNSNNAQKGHKEKEPTEMFQKFNV